MKAALLVALVVVLGSCHAAPPPIVAPVIETVRQGDAPDDLIDMPIAMP